MNVSLGPGLWSLVLGPFGPVLGPNLDLTWDLDLGLSLTIISCYYWMAPVKDPVFSTEHKYFLTNEYRGGTHTGGRSKQIFVEYSREEKNNVHNLRLILDSPVC